MKKKITAIALAAMMAVLCIPAIPAAAATSGTCGTNATWKINGNTLTISGTGQMANYDSVWDTPWVDQSSSISKVVIKDGITHVGNNAFYADASATVFTGLMSISLGKTVKSIGYNAFAGDNLISKVTFPASLQKVKAGAFEGPSLTSVDVSNLTLIGDRAFAECDKLTGTVTIGPSVEKYLDTAFYGSPISGYEVSASNATYSSVDGVLYNKAQTTLISFPEGKTVTTFTVPKTVTTIGKQAFANAIHITNLIFPNNVKTVKDGALPSPRASYPMNRKCALRNVYFGKGLTKLAVNIFSPTSDANPCYKVYFAGNMPTKIGEGAEFWDWIAPVYPNYVRIYTPKGNKTWADYTNGYGTWFGTPAIKTLKNSAAGTVTVTYSKSTNVTAYQIQASLYSTFKSPKTVTVKGADVVTGKFTGLKKGKKYYIRVRAYRKVGGATYTTSWSAKKAITLTK